MKVAAIFILFVTTFFASSTFAFCIYNNIGDGPDGRKTYLWVRQAPLNAGPNYFKRFANYHLNQGEKACCAYTNPDCVRSQNKDEEIQLVVRKWYGKADYDPLVISMPGGGWINFQGSGYLSNHFFEVFNPDGTPYPLKYRVDNQAGYQ
ncbi:hypothetical protein BDF20DRAFT_835570 [Mycotypha africana]|uniref:uncharacterized protein n=1 Tax=Mycotypha africana TaxID=64632 RepID=UPI0022FFD7D6|nr:uncharacterized protein BDF20DRAFT_835570 [Mycotypha africana]KAI8979566.1 hypothetical protein BDF20DRAFT_835570 [Mycotypha africana]